MGAKILQFETRLVFFCLWLLNMQALAAAVALALTGFRPVAANVTSAAPAAVCLGEGLQLRP